MRASILPAHALTERRLRFPGHASTPPARHFEPFWPVFGAPKAPKIEGKKAHHPLPHGRRSGQSGTLQDVTGGTQTHSRRTGPKLGQLARARQGLVRVPESNTKYGGKGRKPEGADGLKCGQVSVSPQGFPSEKNRVCPRRPRLRPLFTGQLFIVPEGLLRGDSRRPTGDVRTSACRRCNDITAGSTKPARIGGSQAVPLSARRTICASCGLR
jgi:hypothetical protein